MVSVYGRMDEEKLCLKLEYAILGQDHDGVKHLVELLKSHDEDSELTEAVGYFAQCLILGDYIHVVRSSLARRLLGNGTEAQSLAEFDNHMMDCVLQFLNEDGGSSRLRQLVAMFVGVSYLQLFVQQNWLGPPLIENTMELLPSSLRGDTENSVQEISIDKLNKEGQCIYKLVLDPAFLVIASTLLVDAMDNLGAHKTCSTWALRCMSVKQQLMEELSNDVMEKTINLVTKVENDILLIEESYKNLWCEIMLELGHLSLYYWKISQAKEYFSKVQEKIGITFNLTGALGKRTKFQENFIAQLKIQVDSKASKDNEPSLDHLVGHGLPKNVALDDDTVLESVMFKERDKVVKDVQLLPLEQAMMLSQCVFWNKSKAHDNLSSQELVTYIESVTRYPTTWCVHFLALFMRSKLEEDKTRKKQRSMMQLETLVNATREATPKASSRHYLFYCTPLPPKWKVERELAQVLVSLHAFKSALDVFLRLELWEDVISCYQILGKHEKAEKLVRQQLAVNETVTLWCLLGDITKEAEHYEKAWELSNHRSSRAQRSLGLLHLRAVRFAECIPCFKKSLKINAIQDGVWFSLGCAAMATNDLELANKAFHRCVNLDFSNGEAWNNLANVCIKLNNKPKAHSALQEALRCKYDSWHMWENFLLISMDIGAFRDAMRAYHRLMDLKDKYKDVEVLGYLVKVVTDEAPDVNGVSASKLRPELLQLMGRVTSQITTNAAIWKMYADLYMNKDSAEDTEKALGFLVKGHRCRSQDPSVANNVSALKEFVKETIDLSDVYEKVAIAKDSAQAIQLLSSAKMSIKQLVAKIKKHHTDAVTGGVIDELAGAVNDLETRLQQVTDRVTSLKG